MNFLTKVIDLITRPNIDIENQQTLSEKLLLEHIRETRALLAHEQDTSSTTNKRNFSVESCHSLNYRYKQSS